MADGKNANERKGHSSTEARESYTAYSFVVPTMSGLQCFTSIQQGKSLWASVWFRLFVDGTCMRHLESAISFHRMIHGCFAFPRKL